MDIEKIKKMNEMSKVLQDHGIAGCSEEGTKMAGEINNVEVTEQTTVSGGSADLLLERITRKMNYEFESLKEEIKAMRNAIEVLAARPPQIVQGVPQQTAPPVQEGQSSVQEIPAQQQQAAPVHKQGGDMSQVKREDVKNGSDPAEIDIDVSVEKMFYYGNK